MKFRSGFEKLTVYHKGETIQFNEGYYSSDDKDVIAMLKNHPNVWPVSASEELEANSKKEKTKHS